MSDLVRRATSNDLDGMAEALALSFHEDPIVQWIFGAQPPRPLKYSRPFFRREGARYLRHNEVYTLDGNPGAVYWDPPGRWKTKTTDALKMAPLMLRGMATRAPKVLRGVTQMESAHAAQPAHYYLAILGTRPDRQGSGIGSALLRPVLDRCDADGVGAYLESSKESNIPFYRRHGFEVVGSVQFPSGPTVCTMWRDPQPPA